MMEAVRASETSVYVHLSPFHLTPYNLIYWKSVVKQTINK
jgi:hypothetical protein